MERHTRVSWLFWVVIFVALVFAKLVSAEPYKSESGPFAVDTFLLDLEDAERDRTLPIKVYLPERMTDPMPVVLVSHGLGGTRMGLSYIGSHWASHGYVCVHMQHAGSDDKVWRDVEARRRLQAMRDAARNPVNAMDRAADVTFVLDELERLVMDKDSKLYEKIDLKKAGIAGHSFGAWTAMAAGGLGLGGDQGIDLGDLRIKCMIPLSPPVSANKRQHDSSYGALSIPALFMTGTLDTSVISNTKPEERLIPYEKMPGISENGNAKYMINFNGADHMTFSGESGRGRLLRKADPKTDPVFHGLILQSTTAFLDCYLLGDQDAMKWLNDGGFVKAVGEYGDVFADAK